MERIIVTIEVARPEDAPAMVELKFRNLMRRAATGELELSLEEQAEENACDEQKRALATTLAKSDDDDHYLVAKHLGAIVGFCRMTWQPLWHRFQLQQFYVDPDLIGSGIGGQILSE